MGGFFSALDACVQNSNSPSEYIEKEKFKEQQYKAKRKAKMDIMGVAMHAAMHDIKKLVGAISDNEDNAE